MQAGSDRREKRSDGRTSQPGIATIGLCALPSGVIVCSAGSMTGKRRPSMPVADHARFSKPILYPEKKICNPPEAGPASGSAGGGGSARRYPPAERAGNAMIRSSRFPCAEYWRNILEETRAYLESDRAPGPSAACSHRRLRIVIDSIGPGEEISGTGITIRYGVHRGPFGRFFLAAAGRDVFSLKFLSGRSVAGEVASLRETWPGAVILEDPEGTSGAACRIFGPEGKRSGAPLRAVVKGTGFQVEVWKAVARIPRGSPFPMRMSPRGSGRPAPSARSEAHWGATPCRILSPATG
jgi:AraC family transcriptional regulator of adaptative response/methylated-DNA-[protein]-cysteine methyltransferase